MHDAKLLQSRVALHYSRGLAFKVFLHPIEESPVGIAAGFDKNALLDTWLKSGCGADLRACGSFRRCNFVCCSWGANYMPDFHL